MDKYKFIARLGRGTHGSVYLFENENKKLLACKSMDKRFIKRADAEICILKSINHINIIKYVKHYPNETSTFIFMEYANYGTLESLISFFKKRKLRIKKWLAWSCFVQLVNGISYLHSKNIAHRDIKPANILLNKRIVKNKEIIEFKICDFSLSTNISNLSKKNSIIGTPYYMAPEIILRKGYDERIDVWGIGVCLYELISLSKPFKGPETEKLNSEILEKEIKEVPNCYDSDLENKVLMCLLKEGRPSISELKKSKEIQPKIDGFM